MKIRFLSLCAVVFVFCEADCSKYFYKQSPIVVPPPLTCIPMRPVTKNEIKLPQSDRLVQQKSEHVVNWNNFRDGRSFADVVKGVKKSADDRKNESKKQSKQEQYKLLHPQINLRQKAYDDRKAQQNEINLFGKRYQSDKNRGNKKHQSAHQGKLYNAR